MSAPEPSEAPIERQSVRNDLEMPSIDGEDAGSAGLDDDPRGRDVGLRVDSPPEPAPARPMRVKVRDRSHTIQEEELDGSAVLSGDAGLTFVLDPPAGSAGAAAGYEVRYGGDTPWNSTRRVPFARDGLELVAAVPREALDGLEETRLKFVVTTTGTKPQHHARGDLPFAVITDLDAPRAAIATLSPAGANIALVWNGADNESEIRSYRVMAREGEGPWLDWLVETRRNDATYSGAPATTHSFRVAATDAVGHVSAWAQSAPIAIDATAPANRPPTLALLAPAAGIATRGPILVEVDAADPDATTPMVRACALVANVEAVCAPDTSARAFEIASAWLPDGPVTIRVSATDGSASAPDVVRVITLDREPPAIQDLRVDSAAGQAAFAVVSDATAVLVDIVRSDGGRVGAIPLVSEGGVWRAAPSLTAGDYSLVFRARDAAGNEATAERALSIAARAPGDDTVVGSVAEVPTPGAPEAGVVPQKAKATPAPVALALLATLGVARWRRR